MEEKERLSQLHGLRASDADCKYVTLCDISKYQFTLFSQTFFIMNLK